ncbi:MAG: FkbM family methyltransferase [Flavobacteriales bacterium]|nr:FkbM family methyltransferase [Flavobacteriales bacterium]MBK6945267.1 FkbM family methyltransferase [Flavobacteriales bacterium]MBK7239618.1 FkbM family methyltransferase [Flavobacteriales bacterium]MBK7298338.1 FkbM family methyltransferase [Flavobacteriales bacterium]MBK9535176.1 FkbM family methyltransferase [Flavobacteriales bacterium]
MAFLRSFFKYFNIAVTKYSTLERLERLQKEVVGGVHYDRKKLERTGELIKSSRSQILQDIFVLHALNFQREGYFVEFGATDGKEKSNTHLLEKEFGWTGILAEPATIWHSALRSNRSCHIDTALVHASTGETVIFNQTEDPELSSIQGLEQENEHSNARKNFESYEVTTISLTDLLRKYEAPKIIDYLSIDTEGSEFQLLQAFDFGSYQFRVITCENNTDKNGVKSDKIEKLLGQHGYVKKYTELSQFDDWYILPDLLPKRKDQTKND